MGPPIGSSNLLPSTPTLAPRSAMDLYKDRFFNPATRIRHADAMLKNPTMLNDELRGDFPLYQGFLEPDMYKRRSSFVPRSEDLFWGTGRSRQNLPQAGRPRPARVMTDLSASMRGESGGRRRALVFI